MKTLPIQLSKDEFLDTVLGNVFPDSETDNSDAIRVWTFVAFFDSLKVSCELKGHQKLEGLFRGVWEAANRYYCHDLKLRQKLDYLRDVFKMYAPSLSWELPKVGRFTKLDETPTFFRYIAWKRYLLDNDLDNVQSNGIDDLPLESDPFEIMESMDSFLDCIASRGSPVLSFDELLKPFRRSYKKWKCVRDYALAYCEREQSGIYNWHFPVLSLYIRLASCKSSEDLSSLGSRLCTLIKDHIEETHQSGFYAVRFFITSFLSKVTWELPWLPELFNLFLRQPNSETSHTVLASGAQYLPEADIVKAFRDYIKAGQYQSQVLAWKIDAVGKIRSNLPAQILKARKDLTKEGVSSEYWAWFPLP